MQPPLTIGIITAPDQRIRAWEKRMLEQLLQSPERCTLLFFAQSKQKQQPGLSLLHQLFNRVEKAWFRALPDAWAVEQIPERIAAGEKVTVCDLLYITQDADPAAVDTTLVPLGCWYIRFGEKRYRDAVPAFYHEVMNGENETGIHLCIRRKNEAVPRIAYDGSTALVPFSVRHSSQYAGWKAATLLPDRIATLRATGPAVFFDQYTVPEPGTEQTLPAPGNAQLIRDSLRNLWRYARKRIKPGAGEFSLWLAEKDFTGTAPALKDFQPLPNPPGCFRADPFLVEKDGTQYLFFEEYSHARGRAHIGLMVAEGGGPFREFGTVLETPGHLSYPQVFEWQGQWYLLPETVSENRVLLYRATHFPDKWEPAAALLENTALVDPTLFFHDHTWWLMGTRKADPAGSDNDQLLLYFSDDLLGGPWQPHPQNPVVTRLSSARPAGAVVQIGDHWYRPAQNNAAPVYGYGCTWLRITELSKTIYREEKVWTLDPGPADPLLATHHFTFGRGRMVIDGIAR